MRKPVAKSTSPATESAFFACRTAMGAAPAMVRHREGHLQKLRSSRFPRHRRASGALLFSYLGIVPGPPLFGALALFIGFSDAFLALSLVALGGAAPYWSPAPH